MSNSRLICHQTKKQGNNQFETINISRAMLNLRNQGNITA